MFSVERLKKIIEEKGPAYYEKVLADNKRALEEHEKKKKEKEQSKP